MANVADTFTYNSYENTFLNTQRAMGMPYADPSRLEGSQADHLAITTTNVSIWSNGFKIGFVQQFTPSESRDIQPIQELGTEGVVQMVPGNTRGGQIQLQRVALYNSDVWNALGLTPNGTFTQREGGSGDDAMVSGIANVQSSRDSRTFGNPFRTLKDQRVPLELWAKTTLPPADGTNVVLREVYYDCWISSYSRQITAQTVTVSENVSIEYSDMGSFVENGTV